jgi:transcriptional regulator with XRE-family HTH domain
MAKPFKNLKDEMSSERRSAIEDRAQAILMQMALQELRQARHLTQQELANALQINQAALSKMENQSDIRVSTLRKLLAAMGGTLKLVATFPEGEIVINQYDSSSQLPVNDRSSS